MAHEEKNSCISGLYRPDAAERRGTGLGKAGKAAPGSDPVLFARAAGTFDRICSGVINMQHVISEVKDLNDIYLIFRKEVFTLTDKDFPKTGITDLHGTQEEIIEFLFTGLTKITYDPKTQEIEDIEYNGTQKSITRGTSFYTALSYGYGSKVVSGAVKGDVNLSGDVITIIVVLSVYIT